MNEKTDEHIDRLCAVAEGALAEVEAMRQRYEVLHIKYCKLIQEVAKTHKHVMKQGKR